MENKLSEVKEGLLCPICVLDLGTIAELAKHFETSHGSDSGSPEGTGSLKDMFFKAKKKLLNEDTPGSPLGMPGTEYPIVCANSMNENIEWPIGTISVHSDAFRKYRSQRIERYTIQINKLIIRLEKLLAEGTPVGNDRRRREFERKVVLWLDEDHVQRCPHCAQIFGKFIGKRKHHCRLCGGITCQSCSRFVDKELAQKILTSKIGSAIPVLQLRSCSDCFQLLARKTLMSNSDRSSDHFLAAYSKMRGYLGQAEILKTQYINMADSLHLGEGELPEAQEVRMSIFKVVERADNIAKRIGESSMERTMSHKQAQLRSLIRTASSQYVKEIFMSLPPLPTADYLENLTQQRKMNIQSNFTSAAKQKKIGEGWTPMLTVRNELELRNADPLQEQICIIEGFIVDASKAGREDEVVILTENLEQLKRELGSKLSGVTGRVLS